MHPRRTTPRPVGVLVQRLAAGDTVAPQPIPTAIDRHQPSGEPRSAPSEPSRVDDAGYVRRVVAALVAERRGAVDIELVAAAMGTSVRTLQRRLQALGLTYAGVVQEARCAAARELLRDRERTIGQIAHALGYSDHAHFTRAFQRWTGSTPRDYRRGAAPR